MIISLHLPKTAGLSFRTSLEEYYSRQKVLRDYGDFPMNTSPYKRNYAALKNHFFPSQCLKGFECVHGHFLPLKYSYLKNGRFITWVRDPVERVASHYFYWLRSYDSKRSAPLHKRVVEEEWSFERFCLSTELKNIYSKFLWGVHIEIFDFIGVTEFFDSEIDELSRLYFDNYLPVYGVNRNEDKEDGGYFSDNSRLKQRVEMFHSKDVAIYQRALRMRKERESR